MRKIGATIAVVALLLSMVAISVGAGAATRVQAWSANLDSYSAVTPSAFILDLLNEVDAAAARTKLALGTLATQDSSSVAITGGSVTGITDLAIADGGTGCGTAACVRTALGFSDPTILPQRVSAPTSDFTSTSSTTTAITGCAFTPPAVSKHYLVSFVVSWYSSATTTGLKLDIDPGNAQQGGVNILGRGASATAGAAYYGTHTAAVVSASNAPTSPSRIVTRGDVIILSAASAPTAWQLKGGATDNSSTVTVAAYECAITYFQLD